MIKKISHLYLGQLEIEIRGNALPRFINQINEQGITIWNIKRLSYNCYTAYVYKDDFKKLRPLLRKRKCQIKIIKKKGLPFFLVKIRKRVFLLFAIIIFIAMFYIGSSFLWFYEIKGLEVIERNEIMDLLSEINVKKGRLKNEIDIEMAERYLLENLPEISWINLKWVGTQLFIDIVEKKRVKPIQTGELTAAKDGIITEVIVLKGQPAVKEGDTVSKGQVLIVPDTGRGEARGIVKADVWYDAIGEANIYNETILDTERVKTFWGVKIASKIFWLARIESPFDNYKRKREIKKVFVWRNIALPIELIKEEHQEISIIKEQISPGSALFIAKENALTSILSLLENGAVIDYVTIEPIKNEEKEKVKVRLLMKVEENIIYND